MVPGHRLDVETAAAPVTDPAPGPASAPAPTSGPAPAPTSGPAPVTRDDYQALARFRRRLRGFLHFSEQAARAAGMTPAQHQLILAVKGRDTEQPPTITELADNLKLRHHSAVELVDRAVAAGLVERQPDPADARCQRVAITARGDDQLAALSALHREELRRFRAEAIVYLDALGDDPPRSPG